MTAPLNSPASTAYGLWLFTGPLTPEGARAAKISVQCEAVTLGLGDDAVEYLAEYARLGGDPDEAGTRTHAHLDKERGLLMSFFDERRAKIKSALEESLGEQHAQAYLLQRFGPRGQNEYRFTLDPSAITLC